MRTTRTEIHLTYGDHVFEEPLGGKVVHAEHSEIATNKDSYTFYYRSYVSSSFRFIDMFKRQISKVSTHARLEFRGKVGVITRRRRYS